MKASVRLVLTLLNALPALPLWAGEPWKRHTIDDSSQGADGVRLADVNGDGLPDLATGWEEGGLVRAYLHPGHAKAKEKWPAVTVGRVTSPEDAVFADLDGKNDLVFSCEEAKAPLSGVRWLSWQDSPLTGPWTDHEISGPRGLKYDRLVACDLDGDGDQDLLCCEERNQLGVFWYENPCGSE